MSGSRNSSSQPRLPAPAYFACVALLTAMGVGVAMWCRPAFAFSVRSALGLEKPLRAANGSFYAVRVAPLLEEYCTSCHGERRQKADLRLDSLAAAMRGGKRGPVIQGGDWKNSELMTRLMLPPEHEKAMPPSGKPSMSTDEVKVVRLWITAGASGSLPVAAIKGAPPPVVKVEFPEVDEAAIARARAPLAPAVKQLQARFPGVLSYESRDSANLQVNASLLGHAFGDAELAAFGPVHEHIVWADFSGTAISDASAQELAGYQRLRTLRLANTGVSDATARALASLQALRSLTVAGTALTESGLATLSRKGVKIHDGRQALPDSDASS